MERVTEWDLVIWSPAEYYWIRNVASHDVCADWLRSPRHRSGGSIVKSVRSCVYTGSVDWTPTLPCLIITRRHSMKCMPINYPVTQSAACQLCFLGFEFQPCSWHCISCKQQCLVTVFALLSGVRKTWKAVWDGKNSVLCLLAAGIQLSVMKLKDFFTLIFCACFLIAYECHILIKLTEFLHWNPVLVFYWHMSIICS
jgi:hypothetical protein